MQNKHAMLMALLLMTGAVSGCSDEDKASSNAAPEQDVQTEQAQTQPESAPETAAPAEAEGTVTTALPRNMDPDMKPKQLDLNAAVTLKGTITFKDLEGGFYALITESGQRFALQGLEEKYRQHGLVVSVTGKSMPDMKTITQFGIPFKVETVEILDDTMVRPEGEEM
ncbi:hypothetical protein [Alteromonas sp. CYL-A6]|uniref:hypothetical protein n=1 Tax=Alteromonas nitratireducens TaxID=3390813 RepID=UPI0034BE9F05